MVLLFDTRIAAQEIIQMLLAPNVRRREIFVPYCLDNCVFVPGREGNRSGQNIALRRKTGNLRRFLVLEVGQQTGKSRVYVMLALKYYCGRLVSRVSKIY